MAYNCKTRIDVIRKNTVISPSDKFGGWMAVNTGTVDDVIVHGYKLKAGQGLDFTHLHPDVVWDSQIQIFVPTNGEVTLTRLIYKEGK